MECTTTDGRQWLWRVQRNACGCDTPFPCTREIVAYAVPIGGGWATAHARCYAPASDDATPLHDLSRVEESECCEVCGKTMHDEVQA